MQQVYKVLVDLNFSDQMFEAKAQTALGNELVNKYRTFVVANPVTCGLVNGFLREARALMYDSGIQAVVESIMQTVGANKYGWALASACENLSNSNGRGNYLQMRAVEQVLPMLEMKEDEIVSYIKSGALKNVMYVEQFRGIAKSIYKEQPIVEYSEQYMVEHPLSMIAESEGSYYFTAGGFFFKTNEDGIYEADGREVSSDFHIVKNMLESGVCKYADNTITMQVLDRTYSLFEQDEQVKCTITLEDKVTEYTVDQLRENNNYFIQATPANLKAHRAAILEGFAKVYENYKSIAILNNVSIISNNNDRFLLIENNGHAYARILQTNHSQPWEVKGDIAKVVESVKKYTHINVTKLYEQSIEQAVTETEKNEKQQIKENLEKSEIEQRKEKIRELTERFKDDPVRLEMLSRVAADLAALDQ